MLGKMVRGRRGQQSSIPEARVVQGGHAPSWRQADLQPAQAASQGTYQRVRAGRGEAVAALFAFWPLIAIVSMGIAMVWSASVFNGPERAVFLTRGAPNSP